ncbi:carbohydrate kinase [Kiritimatiellaeota bacterium B1221]|nr:carbohydrate kinase [Kiritimatiellaeota bacterium B1221]
MKNEFTVAGIGELVWDIFPTHKRLGGAPANFAFHCASMGADAWPISCVGTEPLGKEMLDQLKALNVNTDFVFETPAYPTGTVEVVLKQGKPTYNIREAVAWDHIPCPPSLKEVAATLDAVCFGSLSQRSGESRGSIRSFLRNVSSEALTIYDINLRAAFFSKQLVEESLHYANVLKLSDEELPELVKYFGLEGDVLDQLTALKDRFRLEVIAYTRGAEGSLLMGKYELDDYAGVKKEAVDTVGAGDSFTAAMCMGLLKKWPLKEVNAFASEVSTYVCMHAGATPELPQNLINKVSAETAEITQ